MKFVIGHCGFQGIQTGFKHCCETKLCNRSNIKLFQRHIPLILIFLPFQSGSHVNNLFMMDRTPQDEEAHKLSYKTICVVEPIQFE